VRQDANVQFYNKRNSKFLNFCGYKSTTRCTAFCTWTEAMQVARALPKCPLRSITVAATKELEAKCVPSQGLSQYAANVYVRSADIHTRHMTVHGSSRVRKVISHGLPDDLEVSTVMALCLFTIL
jgi:hypothetical protein